MTPEGRVKAKVKKALDALPRRYVFMPVQRGMGAPSLDFLLCVESRFVAIETKAFGKKLTPRQCITRDEIIAAEGIVWVIRDQKDIDHMMGQLSGRRFMEFGKCYD